MNKKEKWADEVLNSFDGIKKASPSDRLFDKISNEITFNNESKVIPLKTIRWIAVAAVAVIITNIYTLKHLNNTNIETQQKKITLLTDYTF